MCSKQQKWTLYLNASLIQLGHANLSMKIIKKYLKKSHNNNSRKMRSKKDYTVFCQCICKEWSGLVSIDRTIESKFRRKVMTASNDLSIPMNCIVPFCLALLCRKEEIKTDEKWIGRRGGNNRGKRARNELGGNCGKIRGEERGPGPLMCPTVFEGFWRGRPVLSLSCLRRSDVAWPAISPKTADVNAAPSIKAGTWKYSAVGTIKSFSCCGNGLRHCGLCGTVCVCVCVCECVCARVRVVCMCVCVCVCGCVLVLTFSRCSMRASEYCFSTRPLHD